MASPERPLRYTRTPGVDTAPLVDEVVLYHPDSERFCVLNATAARMWEALAHPVAVSELCTAVAHAFETVDAQTLESDVKTALDEFLQLNLVTVDPVPGDHACQPKESSDAATP